MGSVNMKKILPHTNILTAMAGKPMSMLKKERD
jgi:hypothetical protein